MKRSSKVAAEPAIAEATAPQGALKDTTFEAFIEGVRHVLITDRGTPETVATEMIDAEINFLRNKWKAGRGIIESAEAIAFEPETGVKWIKLNDGERVAEKYDLCIDGSGQLGKYIDQLVSLGLHGHTRDEVARTMLARGIESVIPLLPRK